MARMRLRVCNSHIGGLAALVVALCSVTASTQPAQKAVLSDAVFQNVQLLKGIPVGALGGAQRVARLRSFVGKGTYQAFDTYDQKVPYEVFANAPNQRATVVHTQNGDSVATFDGQSGWIAGVDKPVTLLPLITGGELD